MAEMATYIGIRPRTVTANPLNPDIARGIRVKLNATGTVDVQDATAIGDYVTLQTIALGSAGDASSLWGGGKVPMVAAVAVAMGDLAYTAANGQVTNVSTGATLLGKFTQPASGAGVLQVFP